MDTLFTLSDVVDDERCERLRGIRGLALDADGVLFPLAKLEFRRAAVLTALPRLTVSRRKLEAKALRAAEKHGYSLAFIKNYKYDPDDLADEMHTRARPSALRSLYDPKKVLDVALMFDEFPFRRAIATHGGYGWLTGGLEEVLLSPYFSREYIFTLGEQRLIHGHDKAHKARSPLLFQMAMGTLKLPDNMIAVFEDSPANLVPIKQAHPEITTVLVSQDPEHWYHKPRCVDIVVEDMAEFAKLWRMANPDMRRDAALYRAPAEAALIV